VRIRGQAPTLWGGMDLELTRCPACGLPAEVFDRFVVVDDRGSVEHVKIRCITGATFERPLGPWSPGLRRAPSSER
jgi:hypothetical protein